MRASRRSAPADAHLLGPAADWAHLVLAPLWALGLGLLLGVTPLAHVRVAAFGLSGTPVDGFIGVFIAAHLFLVFARSHLDPAVRARHPVRFFVVPPVLLALLLLSPLARVTAVVVATWWDAYHSSLQTFGIGRLFDMKSGNDPEAGRSLDFALNLLLYLGPLLSGALLLFHASTFLEFSDSSFSVFTLLFDGMMAWRPFLRRALLFAGVPFLVYYVWRYRQLARAGYVMDRRKVWLYVSTALCSVWAWGFNPLGMGLFIMNFFHAWQYYALVWRYEGDNVAALAGVAGPRRGAVALALLVVSGFLYGSVFGVLGTLTEAGLCVTLVVSLMHFWYDGFVWSVRAKHV